MNKRIIIAGIAIIVGTVVAIIAMDKSTPAVFAAIGEPHAEHDHDDAREEKPAPRREEMEKLSALDAHAGHDHGDAGLEAHHEDRDEGASADDDHAEHGHEDEGDAHAGHGHGSLSGICPEHRVPEANDALCQGGHLADLKIGEGMFVRLASPEVAAKAGVGTAQPQTVSLAAGLDLPGRVAFNRDQLAYITPLSSGIIRKVHVRPGVPVNKGALLAELASPEIASLKAQFLSANARQLQTAATFRQEKDLLERGISSRREFQQADAENRAATSITAQYRQQLLNYGLRLADLEQLLADGVISAVLPLRAPFTGTVVDVNTARGEAVEPGSPLFTLAGLDTLWIELSVPESRIYQVRPDAAIQARFSGLPGQTFSGQIFQVGAALDERTRTLTVLAEVKNPQRRLKVGMFGTARLLDGEEQQVLAVPTEALQDIDGSSYVFVREEADLFELRRVEVGVSEGGMAMVLAGLSPADAVVSSQGFALKSEVLKARLGASCADH